MIQCGCVDPDGDVVTIGYDRLSLLAWAIVGAVGLMVGIGMVASGIGGDVKALIVGSTVASSSGVLSGHVVTRHGRNKFVLDAYGLRDCRWGDEVVLPWSSVERISFDRAPGAGRRRLAVAIKDGAAVLGEWPPWVSIEWRAEGRGIFVSDWLANMELAQIADEIRRHLPAGVSFDADPTVREAWGDVKSWWHSRRQQR